MGRLGVTFVPEGMSFVEPCGGVSRSTTGFFDRAAGCVKEGFQRGMIARALADVLIDRLPVRPDHDGAALLPGVALNGALAVAAGQRTDGIEDRGRSQRRGEATLHGEGGEGATTRVDVQRKRDMLLGLEGPGLLGLAGRDHRDADADSFKLGGDAAQLGDLLSAEHSAEVTDEDEQGGAIAPELSEGFGRAMRIENGQGGHWVLLPLFTLAWPVTRHQLSALLGTPVS